MKDLKNKKIIITGATGGIGNSIVEKLSESGAKILASGTRNEKLNELKSKFKDIEILQFDISQSDKIDEFVENATKELGGSLDCMVNNAGITQDNLAIRMSLEEWQKVIDINLTSTFLMSKSAIKKMLKNKSGKVVNITSVVGHTGNLGQANYTASKAGIIAMSKSLAIEYAKKNINVNCVSPGFIKTEMTEKINKSELEEWKKGNDPCFNTMTNQCFDWYHMVKAKELWESRYEKDDEEHTFKALSERIGWLSNHLGKDKRNDLLNASVDFMEKVDKNEAEKKQKVIDEIVEKLNGSEFKDVQSVLKSLKEEKSN